MYRKRNYILINMTNCNIHLQAKPAGPTWRQVQRRQLPAPTGKDPETDQKQTEAMAQERCWTR